MKAALGVMNAAAWHAAVKTTDHTSPLSFSRLGPRQLAALIVVIFGTQIFGFVYEIHRLFFKCNLENRCLICSTVLKTDASGDCFPLSAGDIAIDNGCVSIAFENDFLLITDLVGSIGVVLDSMRARVDPVFYESLKRHGEVASLLVSNNHNQLFEPDPYAAKRFLARNYFGVGKTGLAAFGISDSRAIADSLRILYSYISIGCVLFSADAVSQHAAASGVNYTSFQLGDLRCPSKALVVEGNLWGDDVTLSIPSAYVRCDGCSPAAAPTLDMASNGRSCTSIARIRLQTSFYECCRPMPIIDRIAQTSAFSIFCGMISVIVTTVALFPYTMAPTAPPDPATAPC
jgi:hypothetical protein